MATTLLQGVNGVLKRVGLVAGDDGELASLTDSARQHFIDTTVDAWNDTIDEFFRRIGKPRPNAMAESTVTLVTSDRDYALASDLTKLLWPLLDETNGRYIFEYGPGYEHLVAVQNFPANHTGLPSFGTIRPTDGQLYLDTIPTSDENGLVYKYRYQKDTVLAAFDDTMPFADVVARALEPGVAEKWKEINRKNFSTEQFDNAIARAANYARTGAQRDTWWS